MIENKRKSGTKDGRKAGGIAIDAAMTTREDRKKVTKLRVCHKGKGGNHGHEAGEEKIGRAEINESTAWSHLSSEKVYDLAKQSPKAVRALSSSR